MLRGLVTSLVLPSKVRIDVYQMVADLLETGMELEKALLITVETASSQGQTWRAAVLRKWRSALLTHRWCRSLPLRCQPARRKRPLYFNALRAND